MRLVIALILLCFPTTGATQDRFGAWVSRNLGYAPVYTQSIGWDMPQTTVTIADPLLQTEAETSFIETPDSTAWVVGILSDASDARLSGLALVWSDGPYDRVVSLDFQQTQSGYVAFQTPRQTWVGDGLAQKIATQMNTLSPGPVLVAQPDGSLFPVGDAGRTHGCFQASVLYNDIDALIALVVLFQSQSRIDADAPTCIPLIS